MINQCPYCDHELPGGEDIWYQAARLYSLSVQKAMEVHCRPGPDAESFRDKLRDAGKADTRKP